MEAENRTRQPQRPTGPLPRGHSGRARKEGCSEPLGRPGQQGRGHQDASARRLPKPQERPPRERGQTKKRAEDATLGSLHQREDTRLRRQGGASKHRAAGGRFQPSRTRADTHARAHTHLHTVQTRTNMPCTWMQTHMRAHTTRGGLRVADRQETADTTRLRGYSGGTGHKRQRLV